MNHRLPLALALAVISAAVAGQILPEPGDGDPHLQIVDYAAGQIVQLRSAPGYQLMIELSPDEEVQSVALGDAGAWKANVSKSRNRLFLNATFGESATNMTVLTSVRAYYFELIAMPSASPDMAYAVQFRYPRSAQSLQEVRFGRTSAALRLASHYKISGDRPLRPFSVTDDGQRTYIAWPKGAPIPAIYAPDDFGNEALVNGMMGVDDVYVVDGVPRRLTFRIDRSVAYARRSKIPDRRR